MTRRDVFSSVRGSEWMDMTSVQDMSVDNAEGRDWTKYSPTATLLQGNNADSDVYKITTDKGDGNEGDTVYIKQARDNNESQRLRNEVAVLKKLDAIPELNGMVPSIIDEISDGFVGEQYAVAVTEVPGKPLSYYLDDGQLSEKQKTEISLQLVSLVKQLRSLGVNHGDLHSDNIIIDIDGENITVGLIDFGRAIVVEENLDSAIIGSDRQRWDVDQLRSVIGNLMSDEKLGGWNPDWVVGGEAGGKLDELEGFLKGGNEDGGDIGKSAPSDNPLVAMHAVPDLKYYVDVARDIKENFITKESKNNWFSPVARWLARRVEWIENGLRRVDIVSGGEECDV